jgi:Fur family ferric uptake transcriptional regulator
MPVLEKGAAKGKFLDFLARKNLRVTAQRQAIVDTVFSTHQHFTAEQLLEWSRQRDKSVSRATVYRTLPLLTESGLVREMDFGKDYKFYDPNYADHPNHNHIICNDCEKIVEFESDKIEKLESQITRRLGFSIKMQRLQITGSCEELKKLGACKKKATC